MLDRRRYQQTEKSVEYLYLVWAKRSAWCILQSIPFWKPVFLQDIKKNYFPDLDWEHFLFFKRKPAFSKDRSGQWFVPTCAHFLLLWSDSFKKELFSAPRLGAFLIFLNENRHFQKIEVGSDLFLRVPISYCFGQTVLGIKQLAHYRSSSFNPSFKNCSSYWRRYSIFIHSSHQTSIQLPWSWVIFFLLISRSEHWRRFTKSLFFTRALD